MFLFILTFETPEEQNKFEYLFYKYRKLMLHKAYDILHDYHLAEDAASDAFIRIYKNIHKIDNPDSNASISFIVTIVKNVALTMLRKEKSRATDEYDEEQPDEFDLEEHTITQMQSEEIYNAVESLGEDAKNVFLLKYAHDMSHKDIGNMLGISENNVTVILHRAKKKLAQTLTAG